MTLSRGIRLHQYLDDLLIRAQSQEEAQVNTQTVVDLTQSGWIINQEKSELKPAQVFSFVGYEYHLNSALVKPTQERLLKLQDCKMFDVANWVACLNGEDGPRGTPLYEALSVSPQGALEISSVTGQPPWIEIISAHLDWWQNPTNVMKCADLHPKDHSIQLFTDASNEGWGAHLEQTSTKGLWSDRDKRLHINVIELKAVSLALQRFKDQCQNQTVLVATDSSSLHQQTRRNPLGGDVCSPVENHDLVPSFQDNIKSHTHSRVSECDGQPTVQVEPSPANRMVTASVGV